MPELPEVETVRRGLEPVLVGQQIKHVQQRRADLRFPFPPDFVSRLKGRKVEALRRRAKYMLAELDDGAVLIMHLGMSGRFYIVAPNGQATAPDTRVYDSAHPEEIGEGKHDHVVFDLANGARVVYCDPRRFGLMTLSDRDSLEDHPLLAAMGVEPTGNALTPDYLNTAFRDKKTPIKAALLDQRIIAGLGNIYVCEALFYAGISPKRLAKSIPGKRSARLTEAIRTVIRRAIEAGGSSLRDYVQTDGELGYFQHEFAVYGREGEKCVAKGCSGMVKRIVQSGRSSFYCPKCQR